MGKSPGQGTRGGGAGAASGVCGPLKTLFGESDDGNKEERMNIWRKTAFWLGMVAGTWLQAAELRVVDTYLFPGKYEEIKIHSATEMPMGPVVVVRTSRDAKYKYIQLDFLAAGISKKKTVTLVRKDRSDHSEIERIIATSDGGILLFGHEEISSYRNRLWLIKFDRNFKKEWSRKFASAYGRKARAILQDMDGSYFLLSSRHVRGLKNGDLDLEVMKLDRKGRMLWHRLYGSRDSEYPMDLTLTEDGGVALCGWSMTKDYTDYGWIYRLDFRGRKIWRKSFRGAPSHRFAGIARTREGDYLLVGTERIDEEKGGNVALLAVKVDKNGKQVFGKAFQDRDRASFVVESAVKLANASLLVSGYLEHTTKEGFIETHGYLAGFDSKGRAALFEEFPRSERQSSVMTAIPIGGDRYLSVGVVRRGERFQEWVTLLERGEGN
jgi:hypothetical protein